MPDDKTTDPSHMLKEEAVLPVPTPPAASPLPVPPADDIMNAVLDSGTPSNTTTEKTVAEPSQPPPKKSRFSRASIAVAVILLLLLTLPLIVYFVSQQQQLTELRDRAETGAYPTTTLGPSGPAPSGTPTGNCDDCGGFNQGQCGVGGSDTINCNQNNAPCEGGMKVCDGGCYPDGYHSCKDQGRASCYPRETSCDKNDPCDGISCPAGQYCNGGACVVGQGGDSIVSCLCSSCGADRRCDTGCSAGTHGYSNPCGQVDSCDKNPDGTINYSTCRAIKLCDPSCSSGSGSSGGGSSGSGSRGGGRSSGRGNTPTTTQAPQGQCETIRVYDTSGTNITEALRNGTRRLSIGETVTLATSKGTAAKARFRIQGITQFAENDPALSTTNEYRLAIPIPSTITQATGSFEAEVFIGGNWK